MVDKKDRCSFSLWSFFFLSRFTCYSTRTCCIIPLTTCTTLVHTSPTHPPYTSVVSFPLHCSISSLISGSISSDQPPPPPPSPPPILLVPPPSLPPSTPQAPPLVWCRFQVSSQISSLAECYRKDIKDPKDRFADGSELLIQVIFHDKRFKREATQHLNEGELVDVHCNKKPILF